MGLKLYIKWSVGVHHHLLLNTQNHSEKPKNIAFQIGHMEIGKVMKFGAFWGWFSVEGGAVEHPPPQIGVMNFRLANPKNQAWQ